MDLFIDFLKCVMLPVFLGFVILVVCVIWPLSEYSCYKYGDATGRQTKVAGFECYVQHNGGWYNKEEYKYIKVDNQ